MRNISQTQDSFFGTHKGASINIDRDQNHPERAFYIQVRGSDGSYLYDGWAPYEVRTIAAAKREAVSGACLDDLANLTKAPG